MRKCLRRDGGDRAVRDGTARRAQRQGQGPHLGDDVERPAGAAGVLASDLDDKLRAGRRTARPARKLPTPSRARGPRRSSGTSSSSPTRSTARSATPRGSSSSGRRWRAAAVCSRSSAARSASGPTAPITSARSSSASCPRCSSTTRSSSPGPASAATARCRSGSATGWPTSPLVLSLGAGTGGHCQQGSTRPAETGEIPAPGKPGKTVSLVDLRQPGLAQREDKKVLIFHVYAFSLTNIDYDYRSIHLYA